MKLLKSLAVLAGLFVSQGAMAAVAPPSAELIPVANVATPSSDFIVVAQRGDRMSRGGMDRGGGPDRGFRGGRGGGR